MDKTALVSVEIERGTEVLDILDRAKLKVNVALWAFLAEYEDWRLVLAARSFDAVGPREGYRLLNEALTKAGLPVEKTPTVLILSMSDSFTKELRRLFSKTRDTQGMRLGGQMIGDRFVEDAYIYRIQ